MQGPVHSAGCGAPIKDHEDCVLGIGEEDPSNILVFMLEYETFPKTEGITMFFYSITLYNDL